MHMQECTVDRSRKGAQYKHLFWCMIMKPMHYWCFQLVLLCATFSAFTVGASWNDSGSSAIGNTSSSLNDEGRSSSCPVPSACGGGNDTSKADSAERVGAAFGLSIGAGVSTTVGALIPLIPCVKVSNTKYLSAALALSAGVMLYVSFVEIFHESRVYFCCTQPGYYDLLASICFFAGIALAVLLHGLVFVMQKLDCGCTCIRRKTQLRVAPKCADGFAESPGVESGRRDWYLRWIPPIVRGRILSTPCKDRAANANATFASFGGPCSSIEIASGNHASQKVLAEEGQPSEDVKRVSLETSPPGDEVGAALQMIETDSFVVSTEAGQEPVEEDEFHIRGPAEFKEVTDAVVHDRKHLARMGVLTGLAIAIHNFPEGVATFVGSLSSLSLGAVLALAIAIHNIPEGICVAMPVYYATGSKWKGVFWASLSGFAEPLGALLAYIALKNVFSPLVYGICFGLISGMMVYIALTELLPTAYKFHNSSEAFIPTFLVTGMLVMAASLLLFTYA